MEESSSFSEDDDELLPLFSLSPSELLELDEDSSSSSSSSPEEDEDEDLDSSVLTLLESSSTAAVVDGIGGNFVAADTATIHHYIFSFSRSLLIIISIV